ncbi:MAG: hypothetical protein RJA05_1856 [Planctomycetota bacterium]|jgi:hypothetical protein
MDTYRIRTDLERAKVGSYALPLGLEPVDLPEPTQGYVVNMNIAEGEEPDTYAFHVVVSHDRLKPLIQDAFDLMPESVMPIVEVGSRDAYRNLDVYLGRKELPFDEFEAVWKEYEPIIYEDASIGVGCNAEEPFVEVFMDSWKGLCITVPVSMRRQVQRLLQKHGLREVQETWPESLERATEPPTKPREVLALDDLKCPDLDDILMQLRDALDLELNIDPGANLDEGGRELGMTLWFATVLAGRVGHRDKGAYVSLWATAGSMTELEDLAVREVEKLQGYTFDGFYTCDRVAYDDRPDELGDLPPRRLIAQVHQVNVDEW